MPERPPFAGSADFHAARRQDGIAIAQGAVRWTWADLAREAQAIAAGVAAAGLGPGDRVGLIAQPSMLVVAAIHAMLGAGVTLVPISPRLTTTEIGAIASACGMRALMSSGAAPQVSGVASIRIDELQAVGAVVLNRYQEPDATRSAVIIPTSGTTGKPKLVCLTLANLEASADAWAKVLPAATAWLLSLAAAHVSGLGIVVRAALAGAPVAIPASANEPLVATLQAAREIGVPVSHFSLVAQQLARLVDAGVLPPAEVRAVILGGGPIPESLVNQAVASGWPIVPSYGMSETASGVVAMTRADIAGRPWSAGRAMPGVELRIAGPDRENGEIHVRGHMVFTGYHGDPALTASALDPTGWLHTGDLGALDADGWLRVVGRLDDIIISGGENISPAEIEAVIAEHPAVADVAVLGVPDTKWGAVPVALVKFHPGRGESQDDLRVFAGRRLAGFKVPARVVAVDSIPRSPSGKLLRNRLAVPGDRRATGAASAAATPNPTATPNVTAGDGQHLAIRRLPGPATAPNLLMLHATLSLSGQLLRVAGQLTGAATVILMDRRGSGGSAMAVPAPVPVARHVADVLSVLDALALEKAVLFGHSFGGLVALEFAARYPERVAAVLVYEPPYMPLAAPKLRETLGRVGEAVAATYAGSGPAEAAQLFVRAVGGDEAWDRLPPAQQSALAAQGAGALADSSMADLNLDGLGNIACPVLLATGSASDPFYAAIADALAARIPGSWRVTMPGLRHTAPITNSAPVAALIREFLAGQTA